MAGSSHVESGGTWLTLPMSQESDEMVQITDVPFGDILYMIAMGLNAHQL